MKWLKIKDIKKAIESAGSLDERLRIGCEFSIEHLEQIRDARNRNYWSPETLKSINAMIDQLKSVLPTTQEHHPYDKGYADGYEVGHDQGYDDGCEVGNDDGYDVGHIKGYKDGYQDCLAKYGLSEE